MPRKPVVTLPTDFFETGNIRALCMKKGGEEALIVYLQLLCMATRQDNEGKLMLYGNIPLDDATIARLMYKTEKAIETSMKLLMDFQLISKAADDVYAVIELQHKQNRKSENPKKQKVVSCANNGVSLAPINGPTHQMVKYQTAHMSLLF